MFVKEESIQNLNSSEGFPYKHALSEFFTPYTIQPSLHSYHDSKSVKFTFEMQVH